MLRSRESADAQCFVREYLQCCFLLQAVPALQVIAEDGYPKQGDSVRLRPAQLLQLSPAELQMLQHHRAHLEAWGWQFAHPDLCCATGALITHAAAVLGTPLNFTELQVGCPGLYLLCRWLPWWLFCQHYGNPRHVSQACSCVPLPGKCISQRCEG